MAITAIRALIIFVLTLNFHLHLLALAILLVALLDQDASAKLLRCGRWWEVAWAKRRR